MTRKELLLSLRVRLVASPGGMNGANQYLMSYLVDDHIALDAGSLGFHGTPEYQAKIRNILISHSHVDHIASLPVFLENTATIATEPLTVYGNEAVLDSLRRDVFNGRVAPLPEHWSSPALRFQTLRSQEPVQIGDVQITPVAVDHVVPTLGFILEKEAKTVVVASDTGPTDEIWQTAAQKPNLQGVFLESTFPNSMLWLAEVSKHMTPSLFADEVRKLPNAPVVVAVHIKARYYEDVLRELKELPIPSLVIGEPGKEYSF